MSTPTQRDKENFRRELDSTMSQPNQHAVLDYEQREEVNALIEAAQEDLESVLFNLVATKYSLLNQLEAAVKFSGQNPFCALAHYIENAPGFYDAIESAKAARHQPKPKAQG